MDPPFTDFERTTKQRTDRLSAWLHIDLEQYGFTMPMRKCSANSKALVAFISRKTEIDTILARVSALSTERFNRTPKEVTRSDV